LQRRVDDTSNSGIELEQVTKSLICVGTYRALVGLPKNFEKFVKVGQGLTKESLKEDFNFVGQGILKVSLIMFYQKESSFLRFHFDSRDWEWNYFYLVFVCLIMVPVEERRS